MDDVECRQLLQALGFLGVTEASSRLTSLEAVRRAVTADHASALGWSEQALRFVQSHVYTHAGDARAVDAKDAALAMYPTELFVDATVVKLYRATWLVRTGDPSEGLRQATRAINELPSQCRTHEVAVTARDVTRALPADTENTPEAIEFRELLASS